MPVGIDTKTINQQCQIVVFSWKSRSSNKSASDSDLSDSTAFDISKYITSVNMTKSMDSPSGQFEIGLANDRDWKQTIKKGMWLVIYTSNDGDLAISEKKNDITVGIEKKVKADSVSTIKLQGQRDKIRMIGRVDTVRSKGSTGAERGDFNVNFVVSGRNYGVVYEETEIWHNQVQYDSTLLNTTNAVLNSDQIKTVDGLLKTLHDLFFAADNLVKDPNKRGSLTSIARQWLLPSQLFTVLGLTSTRKTSYYGDLPGIFNFGETPATFPVESPTALLNGVVWSRLKAHSIEPYHELYVELSDAGEPKLNFRLMPWVVDSRNALNKFPTIATKAGNSLFYGREENGQVEIENIDIIDWDVGEDDHTRYNLFWSTLNTSLITTQTSNAILGNNDPETGFPRLNQNSIKRHGLRKLFSEVNANIVIGTEQSNEKLVTEFNEFALELWERSHDYESGTLTIIGNNDIRLGKTLVIEEDSPYNSDKIFYIEGYSESFTVGTKGETQWTQTLFLTRGIEKSVLKNSQLVLNRQTPYKDSGDFTDK